MGVINTGFTDCYLPGLSRSSLDLFSLTYDGHGILVDISRGSSRGLTSCDGAAVIPWVVDQHIHGADNADVLGFQQMTPLRANLSAAGVSAFCASTIATAPNLLVDWLAACQDQSRQAAGRGADLLGVHIEGTFISRDYCGAHDPAFTFGPDTTTLTRLLAAPGGDQIKMLTLDCAAAGATAFADLASEQGVTVALGHTNASYAQAESAVAAGARCVTHLMNAMRPPTAREPGLLGIVANHPVYAEIIPNPELLSSVMLMMIVKLATPDRLIAISDALSSRTFPDAVRSLRGLSYMRAGRPVGGAALLPALLTYLQRPLRGSVTDLVKVTSQNALAMLRLPATWPPKIGHRLRLMALDREWRAIPLVTHPCPDIDD